MRSLMLAALLAGTAALAGCATTPAPVQVASANACGTGYVDLNNDGMISGTEWNSWRSGAYGGWDVDGDGRISRAEFDRCWAAGGFYPTAAYDPAYGPHYWTAFDANGDGFLSADEYWSASTWTTLDKNRNGILDSDEWVWWPM